jgi:hypothetical protein
VAPLLAPASAMANTASIGVRALMVMSAILPRRECGSNQKKTMLSAAARSC